MLNRKFKDLETSNEAIGKTKFRELTPETLSLSVLLSLAACGGCFKSDGLSFTTNENATSLSIGNFLSGSEDITTSTYTSSGKDVDRFESFPKDDLSLRQPANYELEDSCKFTIESTTTTPA